ncbi:hypothetical protein T439DRAFT_321678 [Meredithblackwellia eburnea MCA 4105]
MVRLNFCAGAGIFLSVAAVVLLAFGNIGQINSSTIPKHLRIISLSTAGFGAAAAAAAGQTGNITAIYNTAATVGGNRTHNGIRLTYEWGVWGYCASNAATVGGSRSYCSQRSFGATFQPASVLYTDIPTAYTSAFNATVPKSVFTDDAYLGNFTKAANYLVFIGSILAALAMLIGLVAHRFAFLLGAIFSFISFLALAVGLVIYTIIIVRVKAAVNNYKVNGTTSLGLEFEMGNALWLMWAATGCMLIAVAPFFCACCQGRNKIEEKEHLDYY